MRKSKETKSVTPIEQLYDEYVACCLRRTLAKTTADNYRLWMRRFLATLGRSSNMSELTRQAVRRFLLNVYDTKPSGLAMATASVNHFCKWLVKEGWLSKLPTQDIDLPKRPKSRHRDAVESGVLLKVLDACSRLPVKPFYRVRDRAVLSVLAYTGVRRMELLALIPSDVDFQAGFLVIRSGKGDKPRVVAMCAELRASLTDWLGVRETVNRRIYQDALFCFENGRALGRTALYGLIDRACTVGGVPVFKPHECRHGFATRKVLAGVPAPVVQQELGHSRLSTTTEIYIHAANRAQMSQYAQHSALQPAPTTQPAKEVGKRRRIDLVRRRAR